MIIFLALYCSFTAATSFSWDVNYDARWRASSRDVGVLTDISSLNLDENHTPFLRYERLLLRWGVRSGPWFLWSSWYKIIVVRNAACLRLHMPASEPSFWWRPNIALGKRIRDEWSYRWNFLRALQTIRRRGRYIFGEKVAITCFLLLVC